MKLAGRVRNAVFIIKLCLDPSAQNICCQNKVVNERNYKRKSSPFIIMFIRLYINFITFFFVNNKTVSKGQTKTLISQIKLTRNCHNNGLH